MGYKILGLKKKKEFGISHMHGLQHQHMTFLSVKYLVVSLFRASS